MGNGEERYDCGERGKKLSLGAEKKDMTAGREGEVGLGNEEESYDCGERGRVKRGS